uniref:Uncharacterized protein n=1 Tax=Anguilla anguilla TaxID=7936 RepID=A0A0E9WBA9_ANGAN
MSSCAQIKGHVLSVQLVFPRRTLRVTNIKHTLLGPIMILNIVMLCSLLLCVTAPYDFIAHASVPLGLS